MKILFYQNLPSLNSTMLTWTLGQELILNDHDIVFGKYHRYNSDGKPIFFADLDKFKGRIGWVRVGSTDSPAGVEFARRIDAKVHVHLEGLAYFRIGADSSLDWGYPKELTIDEIETWKSYYRSWMSAAYEADSCSVNGKNQIDIIENSLFNGRKLPNCYRLSCGVDARYALTLPNYQKQDYMITVSRFEPNKKVMMIAKALSLLPQDELPTWIIVGSGTKDQIKELRHFCREHRIKAILKPCFGSEKWYWIKRAKIMLQGWSGIPPGEGLVCDTPVLSFNHPDIIEMYEDSIWWAEDNNPQDFADQLNSLIIKNPSDYILSEDVKIGKEKLLNGELYACTQEFLAEKYEDMFEGKLMPWEQEKFYDNSLGNSWEEK